jgi:hypothetical protein
MADEELLIGSHLLDTDDPGSRFKLDDLINEKERIAVRQYLLDRN